VEKEFDKGQESVYSNKVRAGRRRTYFFDVRQTKGEDYYVTLTESTKKFNGDGYTRHKIFLYKEDFNRFLEGLNDAVSHVKNELMPDYDYEQFDRRQEEWEKQKKLEKAEQEANPQPATEETSENTSDSSSDVSDTSDNSSDVIESDEDMTW